MSIVEESARLCKVGRCIRLAIENSLYCDFCKVGRDIPSGTLCAHGVCCYPRVEGSKYCTWHMTAEEREGRMELKVTKDAVLKAAKTCPDAKATLKALFPGVFVDYIPKPGELFTAVSKSNAPSYVNCLRVPMHLLTGDYAAGVSAVQPGFDDILVFQTTYFEFEKE